ncbi:MAG: Maf family protein [Actinomycetota bacterium]
MGEGRRLVLASGSPRRRELLGSVGLDPEVRPADIDETPHPDERPVEYVRRLSHEKAAAVAARVGDADDGPEPAVLAADTTVDVDGRILEKPVDDEDARRMLQLLSGRAHLCHTGVTVRRREQVETIHVSTSVLFVSLTAEMIDWYVATGESAGKAGAYGIQGAAGAFVERVEGSVTNVIGLPLAESLALLRSAF